ncbi:MAG: dTDP-4-dehydrorhamnose 3,5-epimerase [Hyphomonas sp.]
MALEFNWFSAIPEVCVIVPKRHEDERGYFTETYNAADFAAGGVRDTFIQDNHSFSSGKGTLRGLHFQRDPKAQAKLVRCLRGSVLDVAVDLRMDSPTFGHHVTAILSAKAGNQMYVPVGFAHGFCCIEDDCEVAYKVSAPYDPVLDAGIDPFDARLGIEWPVSPEEAILSAKDSKLPRMSELFAKAPL